MIDGIGGAFVFSADPKRLAGWYRDHLGIEFEGSDEAFYVMFWGLDPEDHTRKLDTTFAIMQAKVELPGRGGGSESDDMYGDQPFMVNLRVRDIEAVLAHLAGTGVRAIKREDYDYGRFAWIRDLDGNRIELYQPLHGS
ncbi:MAG: VOC family protein [Gemmatimonadales bacterium]|jgi:catechol 2,3-dioxygenase-like lactoylglutathione lyase family enzyme